MKTISRDDYLKLIGLLTLAAGHTKQLEQIHSAVRSITRETDEHGHSGDAVYQPFGADELLSKLGITIETPAQPERG